MTTLLRRRRPRSVRSSLYNNGRERVEPFYVTFFKVGSTLLALCGVTYLVCVVRITYSHQNDYGVPYREQLLVKHNDVPEKVDDNKVTTLPTFRLTAKSEHDAFGIAETHFSQVKQDAPKEILQFLEATEKLRVQFSERYGGELSARALLERSLTILTKNESETSSNAMAYRIQQAKQRGVLSMAFGGSSAVAGYGNFFHQSFPFIVETLLSDPLELLGFTLRVLNGAIQQISAFPYTWCRSNHMGEGYDVASIDFGAMSAKQMELVLRNMMGSEPESPILVFRDSLKANERQELLQSYVDAGVLVDPIIVDLHAAFAPFANVKETHLPPGFQNWKEFGAPPGAPGKVRQNLTLKQHELYGWILSLHVLSGAELVVRSMLEGSALSSLPEASRMLPRPMLAAKTMKTTKWSPLLYGTPTDGSYKKWTMPSTECRTAFDPVVSGALEDAIIGGTVGDDVDLLHPKGAMYLSQGWVLDLEPAERREKQLMKQWDNLGFRDYQKAYYGVPASGPLSLFLSAGEYDEQQSTRDTFKCLVVCESNTKGNGCNLQRDVTFTVGGVEASSVQWIVEESVAYHGKRLCVLVDVPEDAKLVAEEEAKRAAVDRIQTKLSASSEDRRRSLKARVPTAMGLAVEIKVTNSLVTWHKGPCSIAHIIWESTAR